MRELSLSTVSLLHLTSFGSASDYPVSPPSCLSTFDLSELCRFSAPIHSNIVSSADFWPNTMSSDEETVRRPGRPEGANGSPSPAPSDARNDSGAENQSPTRAGGDQMDEDDDADLFGSEGEDGGSVNFEYEIIFGATECAEH